MRGRSAILTVLPLLLVLLAFALRAYRLDFQSLWSDEGISLLRSSQPLGQMLRLMPVEHAPGYFVLLNLWLPLAGATDFALRFLSLVPGVLTVALAYRLSVDMGAPRAGLAAALLLATGPFQVWYGQEARMYSWLLAAGTGATWFLWRLLHPAGLRTRSGRPDRPAARRFPLGAWIGYVVCTAGTVYLHHFGFLLPAAHVVYMAGWLVVTRDGRSFLRWASAGAAALLLYLPWLPRALGIFGFPGWRLALDPMALPWRYLAAYTVGDAMPTPWHDWLPWLYLALAAAGVWLWWRQSRGAALLLLCATALPLAGAFALALRQPDYHERYTAFISAPLILLAGRGLVAGTGGAGRVAAGGWRRAGAAAGRLLPALLLAGLVAANLAGLWRVYTDPLVQKAGYRAVVERIERDERSGDVILLDGPEPQQIFLHYYRGSLPWHDLRPLLTAAPQQVDAAMQSATGGARRAWVLRHYHDEGPVQRWLAGHAWLAEQTYYGGLYFSVYALPGLSETTLAGGQAFGPDLRLAGAGLVGDTADGKAGAFRAGYPLGVTTRWEVKATPPPLKFSLRLLGKDGYVWAAADYLPQNGYAPSEEWQPGSQVTDRHALALPADLPPGSYRLALVLYDPTSGAPLATGSDGPAVLGSVDIVEPATPPDPSALAIPHRLDLQAAAGLRVLGYGVTPQPLRPGQPAALEVWWQAGARPEQPYQALIELAGQGQLAARKLYPLAETPAGGWQGQGQVVRGRYALELEPHAASGRYRLAITLAGPDGKPAGPALPLGDVSLEARSRTFKLPKLETVNARIGEDIVLRGYTLAPATGPAGDRRLTLYWQPDTAIYARYKAFVHLVDAGGQVVAQSDSVPAGGAAPTETWLAGEVIADTHTLALPGPGVYRILAGLYDPASGQRPPAMDANGQAIPDGAVPLVEVTVP